MHLWCLQSGEVSLSSCFIQAAGSTQSPNKCSDMQRKYQCLQSLRKRWRGCCSGSVRDQLKAVHKSREPAQALAVAGKIGI